MAVIIGDAYTGTTEPIENARVCYQAHAATAAASGSATGTDPAWVIDGETWSVWEGDAATVTLTLDFGATALTVDYIGIGAHTLGSTGADVQVQFQLTDGGAWTTPSDISSHSPTDDSAILFLFEPRDVFGVRLSMSGGSAAPKIAVFQSGEALEFPRKALFTGLPISESEQIRYRHMQSVRGDVIGRAVEGAHLEFEVTVQNLAETFRTASGSPSWSGFKDHTKDTGPFFVASKPEDYPDDVAYARAVERPRFERAIPNRAISGVTTISCIGYRAP